MVQQLAPPNHLSWPIKGSESRTSHPGCTLSDIFWLEYVIVCNKKGEKNTFFYTGYYYQGFPCFFLEIGRILWSQFQYHPVPLSMSTYPLASNPIASPVYTLRCMFQLAETSLPGPWRQKVSSLEISAKLPLRQPLQLKSRICVPCGEWQLRMWLAAG